MAYDGSLIFNTKIDKKGFEKGISSLKNAATKATKGIGLSIAAVGTALVAMGTYATKASIDFESAFAGVRKTVDGTEEDFKVLENAIKDMSKRLPQSASDIAKVAESAGQLGIKKDSILDFTETMVMLGDATNLSSDEAATALARLANITGMSQGDFDRLGSTIVSLGNNFATTESEIVEMGLRLAGTGNQVGLSENQVLALAAAMSSVGINAEAGGSGFSRVMQKINTEVLSGGKSLAKFAEISGMSSDEFSKQWKDKPEQAITSFVDGLGKIQESGGDVTSTLKEMGVSSIQEVDTLLRLSGASDTLSEALGISAKAWEENTALMDEAEQRYATAESKIAILKNNVDVLAITIGNELKASLLGVIDTATDMIDRLSNAFETGGFEGLVEELGSVLADVVSGMAEYAPMIIDAVVSVIQSFVDGIQQNLPQIVASALEMAQSFVVAAFEILPELLVLGMEVIINLLQGIAEMLPEILPVMTDAVMNMYDAILESVPLIIEAGVELIMALIDGMADSQPDLIGKQIDILIMLCDAIIDNLPLLIDAGLKTITAFAQGIIDNLPKLINEVPRIINSFADAIYGAIPVILLAGVKIIWMLIKGLIQAIPDLVANIPQIIMAIVNAFTLYNWYNLGSGLISKMDNGIRSLGPKLKQTALNLGKGVNDAIVNIFKNAGTWGRNMVTSLGSAIKAGISSTGSIARGIGQGVMTSITSIFRTAGTWGREMITALGSAIRTGVTSIPSIARSIGTGAMNAIKTAFKGAKTIGSDLVKGIWNGIGDMTGWILSKIKGFGVSVIDGMKDIFGIKSPSTVMRDQVGKDIVRGIGVGIQQETPGLRNLAAKEMEKLIDDYGRYGEDAAKKYAKLSKKEIDEIVKEHKKGGEEAAKALAKGFEDKLKAITSALDKIRQETVKGLDRLGDATVTALKKRYDKEEKVELDSLNKQVDNVRKATDRKVKEYDRELQAKLKLLDDESNEELRKLQREIDIIDDITRREEEQIEEGEYLNSVHLKEKELMNAKSAEEELKIKAELDKILSDRARKLELQNRQKQISDLRAEMDRVRDQASQKKNELEKEYNNKKDIEEQKLKAVIEGLENEMEQTKQHYITLNREENLQAEARRLALDENNAELVQLLNSYNPLWQDAGQSFGESLLDGLNSMRSSIQSAVSDIVDMVTTADMANAKIRQAQLDWQVADKMNDQRAKDEAHKRAEEARKQGGTISSSDTMYGTSGYVDSMVSLAERANEAIRQAQLDWQVANRLGDQQAKDEASRRAEEARRQGGTVKASDTTNIDNAYVDAEVKRLQELQKEMRRSVDAEQMRLSQEMGNNSISNTSNINNSNNSTNINIEVKVDKDTPISKGRDVGREIGKEFDRTMRGKGVVII